MIYLASPYSAAPESNYAAMVDVCKRLLQHAPPPAFFSPSSTTTRSDRVSSTTPFLNSVKPILRDANNSSS
jgi:hypothetical protein